MSDKKLYRGEWNIQPDYVGYMWSHVDYDGPEDRRIGNCPTVEECERAIDEWLIEDMSKALDQIDFHLRRAVYRDYRSTNKAKEIAQAYYVGTDQEYEARKARHAEARGEVYCQECSTAGGADRPVCHAPPACLPSLEPTATVLVQPSLEE